MPRRKAFQTSPTNHAVTRARRPSVGIAGYHLLHPRRFRTGEPGPRSATARRGPFCLGGRQKGMLRAASATPYFDRLSCPAWSRLHRIVPIPPSPTPSSGKQIESFIQFVFHRNPDDKRRDAGGDDGRQPDRRTVSALLRSVISRSSSSMAPRPTFAIARRVCAKHRTLERVRSVVPVKLTDSQ